MILEAKATRQDAAVDPVRRYELKSLGRKSATPFVLTGLMMAIAAYLKSALPVTARPQEPGTGAPDEEPDREPGFIDSLIAQLRNLPGNLDMEPVGGTQAGSGLSGSGGRLVDPQSPAQFLFVRAPDIEFAMPDVTVNWAELQLPLTLWRAANDNPDAAPSAQSWWPLSVSDDLADVADEAVPATNDPADHSIGDPDTSEDDAAPGDPGEPDDPGDPDLPDGSLPPEECPEACGSDSGGEGACDEDDDSEPLMNRAPRVSAPVYLMDVGACGMLLIGLDDLLRHATDPDNDTLGVADLTVSSGTIHQSADDLWVFQPTSQLEGMVTISYLVTDGELTVEQFAYIEIGKSQFEGSCADDIIVGSMCGDDIDGGSGDDNIDARRGDDIVVGGDGNDHIVAGCGNDVVVAGRGNDIVFGGMGDDHIWGGDGNDRLFGEEGDDVIFGEAGDDQIDGGKGNDIVDGGDGQDVIHGGSGDDVISGGAGNDHLDGGDGNDVIDAGDGDDLVMAGAGHDLILDGAGIDRLYAGAGQDRVAAAADGADDFFDGGDGTDTLDYSLSRTGVSVNQVEGEATGESIGTDTFTSFEVFVGTDADDHFVVGQDEDTSLTGGAGDDTFEFVQTDVAPKHSVTHEITDFHVGDRIRMSKYDLFEEVFDELEDQFEAMYGDDIDDDDIPIRYHHDRVDNFKRTIIEADFNGDDMWETTITLEGHRVLVVTEYA